jgi:hypothetical protein
MPHDDYEGRIKVLEYQIQQALARAAGAAAGGGVLFGVDTSQMLGQSGLAGYWSFENTVTPTSSEFPNTATIAGFTNTKTGQLIISGIVPDAQFTTVGGEPVPGGLCWFAAPDDEPNAAGKLTASMPTEGIYRTTAESRPDYSPNAVPAGVVKSVANYAGQKRCAIEMLPSPVRNKTKSTISWDNQVLTGISDSSYLSVPGGTVGTNLALGSSVAILYTLTAVATGPRFLMGNYDASFATGFILEGGSSTNLSLGLGGGTIALGPSGRGLNWAIVSIGFDGTMYGANYSENCAPPVFASSPTTSIIPSTNTQSLRIGGPLSTAGGGFNWGDQGQILAAFMFTAGPLSPGEQADIGNFQPRRKRNPFIAPDWVISADYTEWDARLAWYWTANLLGTVTSPTFGENSFAFNIQGTGLTTATRSKSLLRNLAPYWVDTIRPEVDTLGITRTNPGARLILPVTANSQVANIQYACDDTGGHNDDNGNLNKNGAFFSQIPLLEGDIIPDGIKRWFNIDTDGNDIPAASTLTVINGDAAEDFMHGSFTTAIACDLSVPAPVIPTVAARQVLVGDGAAFAQDSGTTNRILHGLQNLIRATFTGSVTCESSGAASIGSYTNNGTTSIDWLAHRIVLELDERNGDGTLPAALSVNSFLGLFDWVNPWGTVAEWAALYRALFDRIHALRPSVALYAQLQPWLGLGANGMGQTIAEYNAALVAAMAAAPANPYHVIDVSTGPGGTITQCAFPLPLYRATQAGLIAWALNNQAAIGWT